MLRFRLYALRYGFIPTLVQGLIRLKRGRCGAAT